MYLLNDNPNMKQVFCGLAYKTQTHTKSNQLSIAALNPSLQTLQ